MIAVQLVTTWVQSSTPAGMELPTTLLLLYFCHPLLESFPGLSDMYNYAVYTSSADLGIQGYSQWTQGALCALVWGANLDVVSSELGRLASTHFFSQALLASVQVVAVTDPCLAGLGVVIGIGILLEVPARATVGKHA